MCINSTFLFSPLVTFSHYCIPRPLGPTAVALLWPGMAFILIPSWAAPLWDRGEHPWQLTHEVGKLLCEVVYESILPVKFGVCCYLIFIQFGCLLWRRIGDEIQSALTRNYFRRFCDCLIRFVGNVCISV